MALDEVGFHAASTAGVRDDSGSKLVSSIANTGSSFIRQSSFQNKKAAEEAYLTERLEFNRDTLSESRGGFSEATQAERGSDALTQLSSKGGTGAVAAQIAQTNRALKALADHSGASGTILRYADRDGLLDAPETVLAREQQAAAAQEAAERKEMEANAADLSAYVQENVGYVVPPGQELAFMEAWDSGDPSLDPLRIVAAETSDAAIRQKMAENDPQGAVIRINEAVGSKMDSLASKLIDSGATGTETEAEAESAIGNMRANLEVLLADVPPSMHAAQRTAFEAKAKLMRRVASGAAKQSEIALLQAKVSLAGSKKKADNLEADTALKKLDARLKGIHIRRDGLKALEEVSDTMDNLRMKQLQYSTGEVSRDQMGMLERAAADNPEGFNVLEESLASSLVPQLMEIASTNTEGLDIGEAGVPQLGPKWQALPPMDKVKGSMAYLTSYLSGEPPVAGEDREAALRMLMNTGADALTKISPEERSQVFGQLFPVMNTEEFAQLAAGDSEILKPWVNLVLDQTNQRGANHLGFLATGLSNDRQYQVSLDEVRQAGSENVPTARAKMHTQPDYVSGVLVRPLMDLEIGLDDLPEGANRGQVESLLEELTMAPASYLDGVGEKGFRKAVAAAGLPADNPVVVKSLEYLSNKQKVIRGSVVNATQFSEAYDSLRGVAEADIEHLKATGEYRLKLSTNFREAFADSPSLVQAAERRLSVHNNGREINGFRDALKATKNIGGSATMLSAYESYRHSRPNQRVGSLLPTSRPNQPIQE